MGERILIVSDEQRNRFVCESFAQDGFAATITEDEREGYGQLLESKFDLVIVDLRDATKGLGLIKQIRANPELRKLLILTVAEWGTGQGTMALSQGADGFEPGPFDGKRLLMAVTRLLRPNLTMTARASTVEQDDK
jgi:DNA-binding response OmpR family regulator